MTCLQLVLQVKAFALTVGDRSPRVKPSRLLTTMNKLIEFFALPSTIVLRAVTVFVLITRIAGCVFLLYLLL